MRHNHPVFLLSDYLTKCYHITAKIAKFARKMADKVTFSSRVGLIAATVGSAVGLGNVWRFPAEAQAGGGAAFLIIYIGCVVLLGIPVMVSEFALGRGASSDAVGVFKKLAPDSNWWVVGALAILASYLIVCFYMVVAGWTLEYLWQSLTGALYGSGTSDIHSLSNDSLKGIFAERMNTYIVGTADPLIATYIMIGLNLAVLMLGVRKGIERISNVLMPLLFVLLIVFCCVALTLPKATEGLEFFFKPDFSKVTPRIVIDALGQAFFSLSLGMGILITYSSYFPKDTRLTRTATIVSTLDLLVAVLMGVIIFPTVMSFGLGNESLEGATLVFVTLPEVFAHMPFTRLWSTLFFLLLSVAALTSTISISEVTIAFFENRFGLKRIKACLLVLLPLFVFSTLCSLSLGVLDGWRIAGLNLFDFLDTFATNLLLPMVAFLTCLYLGWRSPKGFMEGEITNRGTLRSRMLPAIMFIIKWLAPALILLIFVFQFV